MEKLGIIIDSFVGITKDEATEKGYGYMALQIDIDGQLYEDGYQSFTDLLEKIKNGDKLLTSLSNVEKMEKTIEEFANKHENVLILGISKHLSSNGVQAELIAKKYNNVFFIENRLSGFQIIEVSKHAQKMYNHGVTINRIVELVEDISQKSLTFIIPKTLDYMIKGGRLTGAKKFIMTKIKMIPILKYDGHVSAASLKRTTDGAVAKVFEKLIKFIGGASQIKHHMFGLIRGLDNKFYEEVINNAVKSKISLEFEQWTPSSVAVHCGPEAVSLSVMPRLSNDDENKWGK